MTKKEYWQYLQSDHWRRFRKRYFSFFVNECIVCRSKEGLELHHWKGYECLGKEKFTDVVACCRVHHQAFHDGTLILKSIKFIYPKKRKVKLFLWSFYR